MTTFATYPDLKDKIALIMGIGQVGPTDTETWGNGAAIARVLAHNQVKIFGCDLSSEAAEFTAKRILAEGGICDITTADVTKSGDIQKVVEAVMSKYGRIDILINNVGATVSGDPVTLTEEVWDKQFEVNMKSTYLACQAVLPIMEKHKAGVIINNASVAGLRYLGKPQIAYNSAKAAVIHFTKVSACIYASKGIRMNCVVPGFIYTPLVEKFGRSELEADRETFRKITQNNVPMGHMGDAFDIANAAVFLASQSARYITGHELVVDGGLTCSTGT